MNVANSTERSQWVRRIVRTVTQHVEKLQNFNVADLAKALDGGPWWPGSPRANDALVHSGNRGYRRIPLLVSESGSCSVLLIAWPPGHVTPIHDHDGLWGIELVLDGVLEVEAFRLANKPPINLTSQGTCVLGIGDHTEFSGSDYAHRCRNLSAHKPALSLHIYGGVLESYCAFDNADSGIWLSSSRTAKLEPALV